MEGDQIKETVVSPGVAERLVGVDGAVVSTTGTEVTVIETLWLVLPPSPVQERV